MHILLFIKVLINLREVWLGGAVPLKFAKAGSRLISADFGLLYSPEPYYAPSL